MNTHEARTHLSRTVEPGSLRGRSHVAADFDDPLPRCPGTRTTRSTACSRPRHGVERLTLVTADRAAG